MLDPSNTDLEQLLLLLQRLDQRLELAVKTARAVYGLEAESDPYRGVQIGEEEVDRLLEREAVQPVLATQEISFQELFGDVVRAGSGLAWLQQSFGLSEFDIAIVAIALAPELDRRYERLYAYLQDDVRCKRPTVDLALNLLCTTALEKLRRRFHFSSDAPLIRQGFLQLVPDSQQAQTLLLGHFLKLDDRVVRLLLGETSLDDRLKGFCQWYTPDVQWEEELPFDPELKCALVALVRENWGTNQALSLYFQGENGFGQRRTAEAIATAFQVPLLRASLANLLDAKVDFVSTLNVLFRQAQFQKALLYFEEWECLQAKEHRILYQKLLQQVADYRSITIWVGVKPWLNAANQSLEVLTIPFPRLNFEQQRFYWQKALIGAGVDLATIDLESLCDRFHLSAEQITNAVATAVHQVRWQTTTATKALLATNNVLPQVLPQALLQIQDLFTAARKLSGHELETLSRQVQVHYNWDDLILPTYQKTQLREICNQIKHQHLVLETWGFANKLSLGRGLTVLFSGSPGTGKTMAAEVMAQELQLDLYKIDLSQMVSKYIGETEKNLNRIFTAATNANAILLFDEADALFGKRSEIKDAHDRYANLEISYLLQKMEEYEGLAILTTNLRMNMDDAFVRRLRFIIEFPVPNEKQRYQIWQNIFPLTAPCHPEIDLNYLARHFELSGANIRNIALAAGFLAADEGGEIAMSHVIQAVRREYQKMGKLIKDKELDKYA